MTGWELLQSGDYDQAIAVFREDYRNRRGALGSCVNIGIAFLCSARPAAAVEAFNEALRGYPESSRLHSWAGIGHWLVGKRHDAVMIWLQGLSCSYTDAAGGMELPLLLCFSSVMDPRLFELDRAVQLINERLESQPSDKWPAHIGRFLLGQLGADAVLRHAMHRQKQSDFVLRHEEVSRRNVARFHFYRGIDAFTKGDVTEFGRYMRDCIECPKCELVHERYLAAHEFQNKSQHFSRTEWSDRV